MSLAVIEPGPATTVQDRGRLGYQDRGFSPAGFMDWRAAALGAALLGNAPGAACLEFAIAGPTVRFEQAGVFCLTGAQVAATLDGSPVACCRAVEAPAGSELAVGPVRRGQFGYLSVAGGVGGVPQMGSRSTSVRYALGGIEGRALRAGDLVPLAAEGIASLPAMEARAVWAEDSSYGWLSPVTWVRVVPGPDEGALTKEALRSFYGSPFTVTARSDRMGYRLSGPSLALSDEGSLASEGVAMGTVQVPAHGDPIVVMADRQTVGGYRKAAVVATCDLPRLAQCSPGRQVRFEAVSVEKAQVLLREDAGYLAGLRARIERAALALTERRAL